MAVVKTGVLAPDFKLADTTGTQHSLKDLLAKGTVLLAFFKVSCPTCQYTLPFLDRLYSRSRGSPTRIVGISQDTASKTQRFAREFGVSFPILLDSETGDYPVSNAYGITHVPSLFLVEPDGSVSLTSVGFSKADLEELARRIGTSELFHRDEKIEAFRAG